MEIAKSFHKNNLKQHDVKVGNNHIKIYVPDINDETVIKKTSASYWMKTWPASIALSEFIINHPEIFTGHSIIELGAGLGLPSMVAAGYAQSIICSDKEQAAVELMKINFEYYPSIIPMQIDWNQLPENTSADIWIMSDVNYEACEFDSLTVLFESILRKGSKIILSTPHRLVGKPFINKILHWCSLKEDFEIKENNNLTMVSVLVLEKKF